MADMMSFPETWEEYEKQYGFTDSKEIYTNGSRLIPSFRVEQWLEHIRADRPTGKWVEVEEYDCVCYQCDQCKAEFVLLDGTPQDNDYNYCPHCGARLGGDTE